MTDKEAQAQKTKLDRYNYLKGEIRDIEWFLSKKSFTIYGHTEDCRQILTNVTRPETLQAVKAELSDILPEFKKELKEL